MFFHFQKPNILKTKQQAQVELGCFNTSCGPKGYLGAASLNYIGPLAAVEIIILDLEEKLFDRQELKTVFPCILPPQAFRSFRYTLSSTGKESHPITSTKPYKRSIKTSTLVTVFQELSLTSVNAGAHKQ